MPLIIYKPRFSALRLLFALFVFSILTTISSEAQIFTKLADLGGTLGSDPQLMSFVQGVDGNLYGASSNLFTGSGGTVFKVTRTGTVTVLYTFCSQQNCTDGSVPISGVILATDGNFYGVTYEGGTYGEGTTFKITPGGALTTLYNFCACGDGRLPEGALMEATDGNLYGTTVDNTVFRINRSGALTTLHSFNGADGADPVAAVVEGFDGELYGTTQRGGAFPNYYGSVFKMTRNGNFTNLVTFSGGGDAWPSAPLVPSGAGIFYGTATGGTSGTGVIFSVTSQGTLTTIYGFCQEQDCSDGALPLGITAGTDGNLYGLTAVGGTSTACSIDCGTIFQFSASKKLTTVHSFCQQTGCLDGNLPQGGLFQATDGKFYGTTSSGGAHGGGTIFSLDMGFPPFVRFILAAGRIKQIAQILGQGFTGTTAVTLNGTPTSFTVVSDTFIKATVPAGATTGYVTVATPTGTLTSNVPFHVLP